MSTNWHVAPTGVRLAHPGEVIPGGYAVDSDKWALVIGHSLDFPAVVIEGTAETLAEFARSATAAADGVPRPPVRTSGHA